MSGTLPVSGVQGSVTAGRPLGGASFGVGEERVVRAGVRGAVHEAAHRLDTGGDEDVPLPGPNGVGRHADGLQRGGAVAIHRGAGHVLQAGQDGRHPGHVVARLAGRLRTAQEHVLHFGGIQLGQLLQHGPDDQGAEVVGATLDQ